MRFIFNDNKIKSIREIEAIAKRLHRQNKKVIMTNGSFDLLHIGHVSLLEQAKSFGGILIIGINSDSSIRRYKGRGRPVNKEKFRARILASFECVDYVVVFNDLTPMRLIERVKPDIFVKSPEYGKDCVEANLVKKIGGKVKVANFVKGFSSSDLIKNIIKSEQMDVKPAVFLDRDGVINVEKDYLCKPKDLEFIKGTVKALQMLTRSPYKVIITTGQSGIGRGYYKEKDMKKLHDWMCCQLEKKKVVIDGIYFCPHLGKAERYKALPKYRLACKCRKPNTGMLEQAVLDHNINLSKSYVIGDKTADIATGRNANTKTILVKTGYGGKEDKDRYDAAPHYVAEDLLDAVENYILKH
ncbi:MAG: hypothetical protein ACD_63C00024G0009 [uncultured bacterium]|nr:MAG: hypothetical protein ACD_63C00024G0009 [uncultured bacterium]